MANCGRLEVQGTDAFEVMAMDGGSEKNQKDLVKLSNEYYSRIVKPEIHALQGLRKNPTARKARKTVETARNQLNYYEEQPEELVALMTTQNATFIELLPEGKSRNDAIAALGMKFINDRKEFIKSKK